MNAHFSYRESLDSALVRTLNQIFEKEKYH